GLGGITAGWSRGSGPDVDVEGILTGLGHEGEFVFQEHAVLRGEELLERNVDGVLSDESLGSVGAVGVDWDLAQVDAQAPHVRGVELEVAVAARLAPEPHDSLHVGLFQGRRDGWMPLGSQPMHVASTISAIDPNNGRTRMRNPPSSRRSQNRGCPAVFRFRAA